MSNENRHFVKVIYEGKTMELHAAEGENLLEVLRGNNVLLNTPCSGKGTCGKCRVKISGSKSEIFEREGKLLGQEAIKAGYRLACYNKIASDLEVTVDAQAAGTQILTSGIERAVKLNPPVYKKFLKLDAPTVDDQKSDLDRILYALKQEGLHASIDILRNLPEAVRKNGFEITIAAAGNEIISVEPGDTTGRMYGIGIDVGTTTVVGYLIDLNTGKKADIYSVLNPQKIYGGDVISRINQTIAGPQGLEKMQQLIIECINQMTAAFVKNNNIKKEEIYAVTVVGNTIMMHFFMGLPAVNIAMAPFTPVTTGGHTFRAAELNLDILSTGNVYVFPCVSGYIGADTVAAVLASDMFEKDEISLLIDIGTNGEIALGNKNWIYACSTAAGPAFEGAQIRNGLGGIKGAINKISLKNGMEYTTIGDVPAIGICGSGIIDALSEMKKYGIIDETGRVVDLEELDERADAIKDRLVDIDYTNAFLIVDSSNCKAGMDIAIVQKDVREVQLAKAAIAAGIKILVNRAGIDMKDVRKVYLAGGFGNYADVNSALNIGLLPGELEGKIIGIGNAAGSGAVLGIESEDCMKKAVEISKMIKYIELSACREFQDEFVENMMF